jgi:5-methylthioribose kinase
MADRFLSATGFIDSTMNSTRPDRKTLVTFAGKFVSGVTDSSPLEELRGGNLNFVWRIQSTSGKSFIIKHAPPHIATVPEIAFDDSRIVFEANVLKAFQNRSELNQLSGFGVRPPEFVGNDAGRHLLLMEDVGTWPNLLQAIGLVDNDFVSRGTDLGSFIAQLHLQTYQNQWFAHNFANLPVQETRLQVQYNGCLDFCRRAQMPDAERIGRRCRRLGKKLNSPGKCLIMGDLWPYSILFSRKEIRLIDWELTHFGRPAQDVAHLAAHLWMMSHRTPKRSQKERIDKFRRSFIKSYFKRITKQEPQLLTEEDERDFQIHFGAEILARTLGNFQKNYLYEGLPPNHPVIRQAAEEARKWINGTYDAFNTQPN